MRRLSFRAMRGIEREAAMRTDDESYYRARALQEQIASRNATSEAARERHDQLAAMYRLRVAMISTGPAQWSECLGQECLEESC